MYNSNESWQSLYKFIRCILLVCFFICQKMELLLSSIFIRFFQQLSSAAQNIIHSILEQEKVVSYVINNLLELHIIALKLIPLRERRTNH